MYTETHTINKLLLLYITKQLKLYIFNFTALDFSLCPITYKCINSNENMFR